MEDRDYEMAFEIISCAGNSKSASMMAIEEARNYNFEAAEKLFKEAEDDLRKAHRLQTDIISQEAKGNSVHVNIILVHSQDHLSMAIMAKDNAEEFIHLYKIINTLLNTPK